MTQVMDGVQNLAVCQNCHRAYSVTQKVFWMLAGRGNTLDVLSLVHRCCADPEPRWVNDSMVTDVSGKVEKYLREVQ